MKVNPILMNLYLTFMTFYFNTCSFITVSRNEDLLNFYDCFYDLQINFYVYSSISYALCACVL